MPKFTDELIKGLELKPGQKDRLAFDSEVKGLGVRVTRANKVFIVQWTDATTGRKQREPLGVWGSITIKAARDAAKVKLGEVAKGQNPREERLKRKAELEREEAELKLTLDRMIDDWCALHLKNRSERYKAEAKRALKAAFHAQLDKPAARLTRALAVHVLDGMVRAGKATAAARVLAYGRACYTWGQKRGKVPANPFANLPIAPATNARERVLSEAEVREVWNACEALGEPWGAFYKLALVTLCRRDEVAGIRRSEISADGMIWTIPGARTKNGLPHDVHLSAEARAVLTELPKVEGVDLLLTTTGKTPVSGFSKAKAALDAAIMANRVKAAAEHGGEPEPLVPFVVHDFRRTGVSTLAAMGFDPIVADRLLNHVPAALRGVAGVYQKHKFAKERAAALDAWGRFCASTPAGNVVVLADRRA